MKKQFIEVASIGRCELVENQGSHFVIEDASGCRSRVPADSCLGYITDDAGQVVGAVIPPPPAFVAPSLSAIDRALAELDALSDQFTGEDLGAQMAAADGFDHSTQIANRGDTVVMASGEVGLIDEISVSPAGWSYLVRLNNDDRAWFAWFMGDEFKLSTGGYRVGDVHEGGEG